MNKDSRIEKSLTKFIFALFAIVFAVMFLLTLFTPMIADDFDYSYSTVTGGRVESVRTIIMDMKEHRLNTNGRVFSHALAELFLMYPRTVFCVFNAANATVLLWIIMKYTNENYNGLYALLMICSICGIWMIMPVFGQVFLWLTGSFNYSWAASICLLFILPYFFSFAYEEPFIKSSWMRIVFCCFSFIVGAYSENASCASIFIAGLFICLKWFRNKNLDWYLLISLIAACIGFAFMMLCPAELNGRTSDLSLSKLLNNFHNIVAHPQETLLPLYCFVVAEFALSIFNHVDVKIIIAAGVLFLGSIVAIAVFEFAVYMPWRSLCFPSLLLIIDAVFLLKALFEVGLKNILPATAAILITAFSFKFILGCGDIGQVYLESLDRKESIAVQIESGSKNIVIPAYTGTTKYSACFILNDVLDATWCWPNTSIARYYGVDTIAAPEGQGSEWDVKITQSIFY